MVADGAARTSYLSTLRTEADRLMHLVENVLAYARLERGRIDRRVAPMSVSALVHKAESRLVARCSQVGLRLSTEIADPAGRAEVLADSTAVEQILFNLVDNACKYATTASDRTLTLSAEIVGKRVAIRLRDHGPGIAPHERSKLFRPFHKSAHEAALSAPGVGLGLALSRRLARAMGGDLILDRSSDGTQFSLLLNLADGRDLRE
jgi:signal transduction histidine kinase